MKSIWIALALLTFFTILLMFTGVVSASNWTVNPGDSIQSVINNASSNDTIIVNDNNGTAYTYTENLVINKTLSLQAKTGGNVTVRALSSYSPVFTINSGGSGTVIRGFIITGASAANGFGVFLNGANNCNITLNALIGNYYGVDVANNSNNTIIQSNNISNSTWNGISIERSTYNTTIAGNMITNSVKSGIWSDFTNTVTITSNSITNNLYGVCICSSSASVNFNRLTGNTIQGLYYNGGGTINATNNWYGTNNPVVSSRSGSDIYIVSGTGIYNPWLILNITANPVSTNSTSTITADVTHNNAGNDTSSQGHIPDDIPITFITNIGTITSPAYTRNGKASAIFDHGTSISGLANITATLDKQTVQINVTIDTIPPTVTANPAGGIYNTYYVTLTATDNFDPNPIIYYSIDNGFTWNNQPNSITLNLSLGETRLIFYAVDGANNWSPIYNETYTIIDNTAPIPSVNLPSGLYNTNLTVNLNVTDDKDPNPKIYYTLDGIDPTTSSSLYSGSIRINNEGTTTLKFIAIDASGNFSNIVTRTYNIDVTAPIVIIDRVGGVYNTTQTLNLTAADNIDSTPVIYYTTDGSDPTTSSAIYTGPITLQMDFTTRTITVLKFMAVDQAGNHGQIQTETYILTLPVVDTNTSRCYSRIQDAINDPLTLNGHVIQIYSGNYVENVLVNKKLTITSVSGNDVTVQAADPSQPVFTINSGGSGSIIQGFTLNGSINLNANNCSIYDNAIYANGTSGIIASNSVNSTILGNIISSNGFDGIHSSYSNNILYGNIIYGCESGIYSEYSNDTIISNTLINNYYGVWTYNSTDTIQFNRITGNTYGLRNDIGTVNATNNWWGSNNPIVSSASGSDIWNVSGNVTYNPWLVLSINASPTNSGGNTSVTADLTHNSQGGDTSSQGHIPDGIPINFTTDFGTIIGSAYTVKGKAATILNLGSTQNATVTATASLDNQNVSTTGVIATGSAILNITSTAIDNSTELPLNTTYTIPLNNSVTWLSVLWINKGMFTDELQIVVDGTVVQDRYFHNAAYLTWQNSYSLSVFNAIVYANQYLPFSSNSTAFWNNLTATYNLTSSELTFIQNHRLDFIDNLTVNIVYSGVPGLNMTVTDPQNNNTINLNFPGNVINRVSQVIYFGSPYEGVKSFAIATTGVTKDVYNYWANQYSNYQTGDAMNAAYNTFLTSLQVEYLHDQIADNITTQYNVTWSRTSPIIISVGDDAYQTYLTLESDHSMGMTIIGTPENIRVFNFVTSYAISPIEYTIMNSATNNPYQSSSANGSFHSVMIDLLNAYLGDDTFVESFMQNGFIIVKSVFNNNDFIVMDPETGIIRDINTVNNFYGAYVNEITPLTGITGGYNVHVGNKYQIDDLGTKWFVWDGTGSVFVASSPNANPETDQIWADDELIVTEDGAVSHIFSDSNGVHPGPGLDITSILTYGVNSVQVKIMDIYGVMIGCSSLYLVQVNYGEVPNHNINPDPNKTWIDYVRTGEEAIAMIKSTIDAYTGVELMATGFTVALAGPEVWPVSAVLIGCGAIQMFNGLNEVYEHSPQFTSDLHNIFDYS